MAGTEDAGNKLRALGWQQGALIDVPSGTSLAALLGGAAHAVVASQDCDIVAHALTEACVDLLPASLSEAPEGNLRYGKNPRRLCVELTNGHFATVDVRTRQTIPKELVADTAPTSLSCSDADRKLLAKWLGKRYTRAAFPDEFNRRLEKQKKNLDKLSKRAEGKLITAIFLNLATEDELDSGKDYEVAAWLTCRAEVADDPKRRAPLEKYTADFAAVLGACDGIKVTEHELRSELDISMEDLHHLKRFDFDYRSEAPEPGGESSEANE